MGSTALSYYDLGDDKVKLAQIAVYVQLSCYVGLSYTICEWLYSLPFELRNIWTTSGSPIPIHLRVVYVSSRYLGVIGQILELTLFYTLRSADKTSKTTCQLYWFFQVYAGLTTLLLLQIVLALRVCALWKQDVWIKTFLSGLLLFEATAVGGLGSTAISDMTENKYCFLFAKVPEGVSAACSIKVMVQVCLWGLTFMKVRGLRHGNPKSSLPVLSYVVKECFIVAIVACLVPTSIIVDSKASGLATRVLNAIHIVFPIYLLTTTCSTCRMISSMHKHLEAASGNERHGVSGLTPGATPVLTSVFHTAE